MKSKSRVVVILVILVVAAGCYTYTPNVYIKEYGGSYRRTTEAALYAMLRQGMNLKSKADIENEHVLYVVGTGLWNAGIWGREVHIEVKSKGKDKTEVSFHDTYYTQRSYYHKEFFEFIEKYLNLNFVEVNNEKLKKD